MADQQQQLDPTQLAELVKELSDDELREQINNLGVDEVLKGVFEGMEQHFLAEKAAGVNSTLQYDIDTDQGQKQWTVTIADGACKTSEGAASDPRLTLQIDIADFIRLVLGQAQGQQLFMSGKLKLKGDMMFAMQMQTFFDRPA